MANTYTTIKTNAGLALETAAQAGGDKITLTQMAVGDGGGNAVTPGSAQTALVREQVRVSLNAIAVDPDISNQFTAEAIIPASAGGFTMREAGLYTADGVLFAVANLPQVYKPSSSEGSFGQVVITMTFQAANSDEVNLSVDENVSVATRLWVENYVIPEHVFRGGTTGQFLAKSANDDGAWTWVDPSASVHVLVDTIEEDQTLAAGQTAITLSKVTANGLGVFINGVRLRDDEWSKVDDTHITLATARNDGDRITLLQNEQTGYSDVLRADRNLSDVDDADASISNLFGGAVSVNRDAGTLSGKNTPDKDDRSKQFATTEFVHDVGDDLSSALDDEVSRAEEAENSKVSGTTGVVAANGDKNGTGLHLNGGTDRASFVYDGGSGDLAWESDVSAEAAAREEADATLQTDIDTRISGTTGVVAANGDKNGTGLHLNGGTDRASFVYDGGSGDLAWESDVSAEAAAREEADATLQADKMDKSGGAFTGDVIMSGQSIYCASKSSRIQFEASGHISIRDNENNIVSWWGMSDGNAQSFNVACQMNITANLSASSLTLPNDSTSRTGNFDLYAQSPVINFHYKNAGDVGSPNVAIVNDGDGQLTLSASNAVRIGGSTGAGVIAGVSNALNVRYGNGNSYSADFQADGNFAFYKNGAAFMSFQDTGSIFRTPVNFYSGLTVPSGDVSFQDGAIAQAAVSGLADDLNSKVSGTTGVVAANGDKDGTGLHLNGGTDRASFVYDGGSGDLAWESDVSAEAAAREEADATLQTDIDTRISGTTGVVAANGDKNGTGLHLNGGTDRASFVYDGGSGDLAWYSSLTLMPTLYASSTSVTVPSGVSRALIEVVGGGGSGCSVRGTSISDSVYGAGGAAGGYLYCWIAVSAGDTLGLTVGAGASAQTNTVNGQTNGGDTIVTLNGTEIARAGGGTGGIWNSASSCAGGTGGGATTQNGANPIRYSNGSDGGDGQTGSTSISSVTGYGGAGVWGGGGRAGNGGGNSGTGFGAGGGGAYDTSYTGNFYKGGSGHDGCVVVAFR
ncbi:phage tail protein [Gluconobacter oxydans]|uniref:phage tail protein n=1 Tax=Gluconobacter oxydans TaxID=442 RepID=UPI00264917B1|nr:phage tail protein [Gluconobacter oxydans]WKE49037.1 phage tail protein [Gluconobacter oxydans]